MVIRTVIDCDPGRDDALAILGLLGANNIQVDFISTVAGNVTLDSAVHNALGILAVAGVQDVPVCRGASRPLARELNPGTNMHGNMGTEEPKLPPALETEAGPAQPALEIWCAEETVDPKRLVATGPLTNIGRLLQSNPDALAGVDQMFVMGGTISQMATRVSDSAEFNFYTDPEAADLVLQSGVEVRLYDYDVTTSCQIPVGQVDEIGEQIGGSVGRYVTGWLENLWEYANKVYGRKGIAVHDMYAAAGAAGFEPERWEPVNLEVDCSPSSRGTVRQITEQRPHFVARGLNPDDMVHFLTQSARNLPAAQRDP